MRWGSKSRIVTESLDEESEDVYTDIHPMYTGQFTGLTDKNGTEIYEGDIVQWSERRYHFGNDKGLQTIKYKSPVVWEDGAYMISSKQETDTYLAGHVGSMDDDLIVIGNIYKQEI